MTRFLWIFLVSAISLISAQTQTDSLFSKILNEKRTVQVFLPKNYGTQADRSYPVIYLLDADINMPYYIPMSEFLKRSLKDKAQDFIIVGVESKDRTRDYTPTKSSAADPKDKTKRLFKDSGGADLFLKYMLSELKPDIAARYWTTGYSAIVGHSFGGLFVLNTLVKNPESFDAYIANDASFWWDNSFLLRSTQQSSMAAKDFTKQPFVFIGKAGAAEHSHGFEEGQPESLLPFTDFLKRKGLAPIIKKYPDETHGSVSYKANFDALRELSFYLSRKNEIKSTSASGNGAAK